MPAKSSPLNSNAQMAEHLIDVLSSTYVLMVKSHGCHWNVTGPLFPQLHTFFEAQYNELFTAADEVAERIRALNYPAPASMATLIENSVVKEADGRPKNAEEMVKDLLKSNEQTRQRIEEARAFAEEIEDRATEDMLNGRLAAHDKTIWMMRAQVGN